MGLEKCGKLTVSRKGKAFVITVPDRVLTPRFVVNREGWRKLDCGVKVWVDVLKMEGDIQA